MIDKIVKAIVQDLNTHIKLKFSVTEPKVIISNLVNQDGGVPPENNNKVICSLINIEQERIRSNGGFTTSGSTAKNAPINLDLYLMFSSNFAAENYVEGLRFLSLAVGYFQGKSVFTPQNTPNLPSHLNKITFNMFNVDLGNLSHLWGALGAKYMPSVIYQVRMVSFFGDRILEETPAIEGLGVDSGGS